jgi:putative PIN family toxin of toxin-antitoxin system
MIRAVIDINVLISAIISHKGLPYQIWTDWRNELITLIISEGMIIELAGKLILPRFAKYKLTDEDIASALLLLRTQSSLVVVPTEQIDVVTGDPEDDLVLATVKLSNPDYFVTYDGKLLDLKEYEGAIILMPHKFLSAMRYT